MRARRATNPDFTAITWILPLSSTNFMSCRTSASNNLEPLSNTGLFLSTEVWGDERATCKKNPRFSTSHLIQSIFHKVETLAYKSANVKRSTHVDNHPVRCEHQQGRKDVVLLLYALNLPNSQPGTDRNSRRALQRVMVGSLAPNIVYKHPMISNLKVSSR